MGLTGRITVYPEPELEQRIRDFCEREDRSVNKQALRWIRDGLERELAPDVTPIRSIAVTDDGVRDMISGENLDPVTLEPVEEKKPSVRATSCPHGRKPNEFCRRCDGSS